MLRSLAIPLVPLAVAAAVASPARGEVATPTAVKLVDCSRETLSASFHGRMKQIDGGERMYMRFTLQEKRAAAFVAVSAPGLGRWQKSRTGVTRFGYRQTVRGLQQGASYRMQVTYRWYDEDRRVIAKARRRSRVCRQFVRLPNLAVSLAETQRTQVPGVLRYGVAVENTGVAAASAVAVQLSVDGGEVDRRTIPLLRAGASRRLDFRAPACTTSVRVAVDPDGVLAESVETDNVQELVCADLPSR